MLIESTTVQTIIREVSADLETPVSLYLKLRGDGASFLLESVEGGERIARYSFIGVQPRAEYILRDGQVEIKENGEIRTVQPDNDDPMMFLQNEISRFPAVCLPNAPRFTGGLVGYLGY
jgi:anthranilate synthase component 1